MAGQKISKIFVNSEENGVQNVSMNIYVMERQLLIDEIKKGFSTLEINSLSVMSWHRKRRN